MYGAHGLVTALMGGTGISLLVAVLAIGAIETVLLAINPPFYAKMRIPLCKKQVSLPGGMSMEELATKSMGLGDDYDLKSKGPECWFRSRLFERGRLFREKPKSSIIRGRITETAGIVTVETALANSPILMLGVALAGGAAEYAAFRDVGSLMLPGLVGLFCMIDIAMGYARARVVADDAAKSIEGLSKIGKLPY